MRRARAAIPPGDLRPAPDPRPPAVASPACRPVDLDGLRAALAGGPRPQVVNHWATWCDGCVAELPLLARAAAELGHRADFVGVSWDLFVPSGAVDDVAGEVAAAAAGAGLPYPSFLYLGTPEALFSGLELDFHQIPQTWVVAPSGLRVWVHRGELSGEGDLGALAEAVGRAAQEGGAPAAPGSSETSSTR